MKQYFETCVLCQKDRVTFGNFFLLFVGFRKQKKSSMVTVCNNLGADLKERSVCKPTCLFGQQLRRRLVSSCPW